MKQVFLVVFLVAVTVLQVHAQLSRTLSPFRELDVTDKIRVRLLEGNEDKIVIEGELANQMELTQTGDVLRLKMTTNYILQGHKVDVSLYTTNLSSIIARKGAQVTTDSYEIDMDSIYVSANEGARIDLRIHTDEIEAWTTAGAVIRVEGQARDQSVNCTFGGFYEAKDLLSDHAYVRTNAGGKCQVNVGKSVDAQTRAGGVIEIYGNPPERKQRRLAGGKINFME
ncbi:MULTISPECIES: head GIN domain-containing protein [Sphingobacterium]|uniref:head GIN domain-containing protein n=1 Tax=Sphingobacterium TaxID=28453 RepID=UPI0013DB2A7B|nr:MULTISPECIES: head GIN domain-containing protein [unclassified Sphingobacterium]